VSQARKVHPDYKVYKERRVIQVPQERKDSEVPLVHKVQPVIKANPVREGALVLSVLLALLVRLVPAVLWDLLARQVHKARVVLRARKVRRVRRGLAELQARHVPPVTPLR
jgi:hypothetical protein